MGKARAFFGLAAAVALSAGALLVATGAAVGAPGDKIDITICHATGSTSNPYILETPATEGQLDGHIGHTGPIFNAADPQTSWGDIIPPHGTGDLANGLNWTPGGIAIQENGCNIPFGDVVVNKTVVDPSGVATAGQTYSITLTCDFEGSPVVNETVSLAGGATSDPVTDVQGGSQCNAVEDTTGIANLASSTTNGPVTVAGDTTNTVVVTNTYNEIAPANEAAAVVAPAKFTG